MQTPVDAALVPLDAVERGFVLGTLLLGTADDADATASLLSPSRERCAAALAALATLPRADRVRLTGAMAREAMAAIPPGIDTVDPEQLAALLAGEAPETWPLIAREAPGCVGVALAKLAGAKASSLAGGPAQSGSDPALLVEVQRAALASIVALPPRVGSPPAGRPALALAAAPAGTVSARAAEHGGAPALARALADEEGEGLGAAELLLALAQRLPPTLGRAFLEATRARRRAAGLPELPRSAIVAPAR